MRGGYQKGDDWLDPFDGRGAATFLDDPRFHQQNAYAIAMRTLGYFESALGRRTCFGFKGHQLHIAPHAFAGPNAYYQRENRCLCFGYFPGPGGRVVYTCLSHDVVAHEMTHALLDGLRPRFIDPSSPDQAGFHEGFADVVALLSVLSDRAIVEQVLIRQGVMRGRRALIPPRALTASALKASALLGLAEQFGASIPNDAGTALRRSVSLKPSARWQEDPDWEEPHQRGEILVAAVMDAFLAVWVARIAGLGIVARGMYDGNRVVEEGVAAANHLMTMCIRALDYAPSTDLQYVDYLSALLTADKETVPDDSKYHYRQIVRKTFGAWGIQPVSHPGGDGCWESFGRPVSYRNLRAEALRRDPDEAFRFIWENFEALKLAREAYTQVQAVHPVARVAPDGLIVRETVVDYLQILAVRGHELGTLGLRRPEELPTGKEVRLMRDTDVPWPIEINPRYTASIEVLERSSGTAFLLAHRDVFHCSPLLLGEGLGVRAEVSDHRMLSPHPRPLSQEERGENAICGKAILYARDTIHFPCDGPWSSDSEDLDQKSYADLPHAGEVIERGSPLLTLFASGETVASCKGTLQEMAEALDRRLWG